MVRYSFLVRLSHPLLHAGLSRRLLDHLVRSRQDIRRNREADLLAVFRLITSSNFFSCSAGGSAGFVPFRILSTYLAARPTVQVVPKGSML